MSNTPTTEEEVLPKEAVPAKEDAPPKEKIGKAFFYIWAGQFISMIGTSLTGFALGVWLFQRTGSVLDFTQLTLFATLPALMLMPWSGSIADRGDKRMILMLGELVALLCTATMALLFWFDAFEVWQLFILQAILSISMAFQGPAAYAAISVLVPKSQFGRASGIFQLANAVSQLGGPLIAASLLGVIGITGIIAIDVISFSAALLGIALADFPLALRTKARVEVKDGEVAPVKRGALQDMAWAVKFLLERPTMSALYFYTSMGSFLSSMVIVLIQPMVLSNYSAKVLAWVATCGGIGILASGVLMVTWGGPKKWTPHVLGFNLILGLAIAVAGFNNSVAVLCICAFIVMLCSSTLVGCMSGVWRRKLPVDRQGSFGALQQAVALSLVPLSAVIGGTLAHFLFEPALLPGGMWFETVGSWFGTGKGRGTGFLFFVVGLLAAGVSLFSLVHPRLYRFDAEVKDAL